MHNLGEWENFYLIVGPAAGALIGLQFVIMTLVAEQPSRTSEEVGNAFSTPNVVHFAVALLISSLAAMPWPGLRSLAVALVAIGVFGVIYALIVSRRLRNQNGYEPELIDWVSYVWVPAFVYVALVVSAAMIFRDATDGLFGVGAAALALLFIGIYNCWDGIIFLVARKAKIAADKLDGKKGEQP